MSDVLLTHSYHLPYDPKQVRKMQPYVPLGTLYAASALRVADISVAVFDTMLEPPAPGFANALRELGEEGEEYSPSPFNAFMNIPIRDNNSLSWEAPTTEAGQYIAFRAEMDLIIVFSACPNDVLPINGNQSRDAHFLVSKD